MFFYRIKTFVKTCLAVLFALGVGIFLRMGAVCRLPDTAGTRTFYLYSRSSQALQKERLEFSELFSAQGESVAFTFDEGEDGRKVALEVIEEYEGEVLLCEEAGGTVSYYAYTPKLVGGIIVQGVFVNLHVAVRGNVCVAGYPIIFGGF